MSIIKKTTQSYFLFKYGLTLFIITALLMSIPVSLIMNNVEGTYIPTLIMIFLAPFLGGIIAGEIAKRSKNVEFKEKFNRNIIILNICIHILIYFSIFTVNIFLIMIYGIGAFIGAYISKKTIEKHKEKIQISKEQAEIFTKGEKLSIQEFKLGKLNGESIREFLKEQNLEEENYLLVEETLTFHEKMMYSAFVIWHTTYYIMYFDDKKLYFFELSKMKKTIKSGFFVNLKDIKIEKLKKRLIQYKIRIKCKDESIINLRIVKKVSRLFLQKQYSEKLYQKLLELKNKEERSSK